MLTPFPPSNAMHVNLPQGGQGGRIVNVASVLGIVSPAISASLLFSGNCAAKAANISLTRMFADKKLVDKTVSFV